MFNILYQRNSNGSIQQWQIFVGDDKYWTVSGKKDGKLVESSKTTCEGKNIGRSNETTPEKQALLEAQSKYKKKTEGGYSEDLASIDNTGLLEPMLAKEWKKYSLKTSWPVISSPKLDGVRVNATKSGLVSRNGKPFVSVPHIHEQLEVFYNKYPEYVLDGELYNPDFKNDFDKIISLVRKSKPTAEDFAESAQLVQFWVFDIFRKDGKEALTSFERKELLTEILLDLQEEMYYLQFDYRSVQPLEFKVCGNQEELDQEYAKYLEDGVEGQMINSYNALYQHKRTQDLLKRKEFQDAEYKIVDIVSGVGNREGCGKLVCQIGDSTFDCSVKGSVEYMQELLTNKDKYIGKMATVKFQNFTPKDNKPRFPVCISIGRGDYE